MKVCPECKTENHFEGAQFCKNCGSLLPGFPEEEPTPRQENTGDELEFVITERDESGSPEIPGTTDDIKDIPRDEDNIEISQNADLLQAEATGTFDQMQPQNNSDLNLPELDSPAEGPDLQDIIPEESTQPVESSVDEPSYPDFELTVTTPEENTEPETAPEEPVLEPGTKTESPPPGVELDQEPPPPAPEPNRESPPPAPDWKSDSGSVELPPNEPLNEIRSIDDPAESKPVIEKKSRVRGLAHFKKNHIRLVGNAYLHPNDEILINGKPYLLRPWELSRNMKIGLMAGGFVIVLIIIASFFINPTISGEGEIIGVILDQNGQPYLGGARVTLTELGKRTTSNSQGFFHLEDIPTGTYNVTYELGDDYVGEGNVTVTAGQSSMMTFGNLRRRAQSRSAAPPTSSVAREPAGNQTARQTAEPRGSAEKSSSRPGKIKLVANVDGAKFEVDGKTLGAGNNVYSGISPGKHKVQVSTPGYSEYTAVITVSSGKTKTLKVNLDKKATAPQEKSAPTAEEYYASGKSAMKSGDYENAIGNFTRAIEMVPNYIDAYESRAECHIKNKDHYSASMDFIRIGEIHRVRNNTHRAIEYFTLALKNSIHNKIAMVGRAGARLENGDYRPALVDYEDALGEDKYFYPALFGAGICQFKLGNHKEAEKYFDRAREQRRNDPSLYQYMMLNYLARDDIKNMRRAYQDFEKCADNSLMAEFKSSSRYAPVVRLIEIEDL